MPGLPRRALLLGALAVLALAAIVATLDYVLLTAWGSRAPAWSHLWCSPSALRSTAHGHSGPGGIGGISAAALTPLRALLPHWPHLLPILLALATLAYLRRANTRYHAA